MKNDPKAKTLAKLAALNNAQANKYLGKVALEIESTIRKSKNNDEIFQQLELLEQFYYRTPKSTLKIVQSFLNRSPISPKPIGKLGDYVMHGKDHDDILKKAVELLNETKYVDPVGAFKILVEYSKKLDDKAGARVNEIIRKLAAYDYYVITQPRVGYAIQLLLLKEIKTWPLKTLLKNADVVMEVGKSVLSPTFEGYSSNYREMTFRSGPVVINDALLKIRKAMMDVLEKIYLSSKDPSTRRRILGVLQTASETPTSHVYGDDFTNMVMRDSERLINFFIKNLGDDDLSVLEQIDEIRNWLVRRFGVEKMPSLKKLEKKIGENKEYSYYRVFVGYDGKLAPDFDFEREKRERTTKVKEYVESVTEANLKEWEGRILLIAKTNMDDRGKHEYFFNFLHDLAREKSELMFALLEKNQTAFRPFLIAIVLGLLESHQADKAEALMKQWIHDGEYLIECAYIFDRADAKYLSLFGKLLAVAKKKNDLTTLCKIASVSSKLYPQPKNLKGLFFQAVRELTRHKNSNWIFDTWYRQSHLIKNLTKAETKIILGNLVHLPRIDFQAEEILVPVAEKYPLELIDFFKKRVAIKAKMKQGDFTYDAVPYELHKIAAPLSKHPEVIAELLTWFGVKPNKWLYEWEASQLLQRVFPGMSPKLESSLIDLVNGQGEKGLEAAMYVIGKYQGQDFLWNLCRAIIKKYFDTPEYPRVRANLFGYLSQTGVVDGEFGFRDAYLAKREQIRNWDDENKESLKNFLKEYGEFLESQAAGSEKSAQEDIELRKKQFGDAEENK